VAAMGVHLDDTGQRVSLTRPPRSVVSLVPSLTEAIALSRPGVLVGATRWCTHPADLAVQRVGGTKNPDLRAILALAPDLVVANLEENRPTDLRELRHAGLAVWTTDIRDVPAALRSLRRLLSVLERPDLTWLAAAESVWSDPPQLDPHRRVRAVVPIWRRPWMHLGSDTYAGDVLRRLGVDNVLAGAQERYPRLPLADLPDVDLVVLPDEPYPFSATDGPESFPRSPCALVDGRALTWYGPAMVEAPGSLLAGLRTARDTARP
jgi:ABC-type hemin transport system substrate-binding protein